jgi:hypothetical protein
MISMLGNSEAIVALKASYRWRVTKKSAGVEDQADLALAAKLLTHDPGGRRRRSVVVGENAADVVGPLDESLGDVVHEDELDALLGRLAVRPGGRDRVGRDRDDDAGVPCERCLDVGHLGLGLEVGVRLGDDLDAHLAELVPQARHLGDRPVVAAVVHDDGGRRAHAPDLLELGVGEGHLAGRRRCLAVRSSAEDLVCRRGARHTGGCLLGKRVREAAAQNGDRYGQGGELSA